MHQQVDANHFVDVRHSQSSNTLQNLEENPTEEDGPHYENRAAKQLDFKLFKATCS